MADLSDILRGTGRPQAQVTATVRRPLQPSDLALLDQPRPSGQPDELKRITDRHHQLARALAAGLTPTEAAVRTGYSLSRVSILQADPAMQDLIAHYRGKVDAEFGDLAAKLASLSQDAVAELHNRIEDDPNGVSLDALLDIAKFAADRTGHGPSTKSTIDVRVDLAGRLEAARKRIADGKVIDHVPTTLILSPQTDGSSDD